MLNSIVNTYIAAGQIPKVSKLNGQIFSVTRHICSTKVWNWPTTLQIIILLLLGSLAVTCSCRPQGQFDWNNIKPQYTDLLAQWKAKQLLGILRYRYPFLNIIFLFNFK